jgi:L-rhamnose mutarotase
MPADNIAEYERRHREMWPELAEAIRRQGGRNYTIWALPEVDRVFGCLEVDDLERWQSGGSSDVTRRWWKYMSDLSPTGADFAPVAFDPVEVFHQD